MNEIERYVIEEFIEEYKLGHYGYEDLRRRLMHTNADLSILDNLPVVSGVPKRPAMLAGADNPWMTGSEQVEGSMITYDSGGTQVKAYLAKPKSQGPKPGIVLTHENKGLVEYVKDVANGLASNGYVTLAPDLLTREGGTDSFANPIEEVPGALSKIPPERHVGDLKAAVDYLVSQNVGPIGAIGFCFGGGQTWRLATQDGRLAAAVPFYGPNPPLEDVPNVNAKVFAVYGGLDERINAGIDAIKSAMAQHGKTLETKVYPDSQHAFHNHTNPPDRYNPEQAKVAWADALAWFKKYLG